MRVTVVCSGNICRSPIGEVVLRDAVARAGLVGVVVDSYGTGDWHVGMPADDRAVEVLAAAGLDGSGHRARRLDAGSWSSPQLLLAADRRHFAELRRGAPAGADVRMLRSFDPALADLADDDVRLVLPDPYYDGSFAEVLAMVQAATPGVVAYVRERLS